MNTQKLIIKALTPILVIITSLFILYSNLETNGKEQLLLALISGYFGNLVPPAEELLKEAKDTKMGRDSERLL